MEIANRAKCFCQAFHGVTAERAMHMKINETRSEIISRKINDVFPSRPRSRADGVDFSVVNNHFKPVADSIGKNQTRVCEDHGW